MQARLLKASGNVVTFELPEPMDLAAVRRKSSGVIMASVEFEDSRFISPDQRKKIYALFGDIEDYTGYDRYYIKSWLKCAFELEFKVDNISFADGKMSVEMAGKFIEFVIEFCFMFDIPFYERQYHMDASNQRILFMYVMNRRCCCCGKPNADIHHIDAIGMGRDRNKHDHTQSRVLSLCRVHHSEAHNLGVKEFMNKYKFVGIKLKEEQLKQIGVI